MSLVSLWHMPQSVKIRIWLGLGIRWTMPTLRPLDLSVGAGGLACGLMAQTGTSTRMELEKPKKRPRVNAEGVRTGEAPTCSQALGYIVRGCRYVQTRINSSPLSIG